MGKPGVQKTLLICLINIHNFRNSDCFLVDRTNDSTAKIGMNFAYIAINVRNFNSKADFREKSLNIKQ